MKKTEIDIEKREVKTKARDTYRLGHEKEKQEKWENGTGERNWLQEHEHFNSRTKTKNNLKQKDKTEQ